MFTGIIEQSAPISSVADRAGVRRLQLSIDYSDARTGESIAVNGVCLTIAELSAGLIAFDVIPETLQKTNLGSLVAGDLVHLERALRIGDRIDGHFVQGHIDGPAILVHRTVTSGETRLRLRVASDLSKFVVPKGSVCLDGVSLTVAGIDNHEFEVALIPTTIQRTQLALREVGWGYNFEADVLSRTIISWMERREAK